MKRSALSCLLLLSCMSLASARPFGTNLSGGEPWLLM